MAWTRRDFYVVCDLISAVCRHSLSDEAANLLNEIWWQTEYSYTRRVIAPALGSHPVLADARSHAAHDAEAEAATAHR